MNLQVHHFQIQHISRSFHWAAPSAGAVELNLGSGIDSQKRAASKNRAAFVGEVGGQIMSFTALMWGVVFFVSVLGALWALERMQEDEA